MQIPFADPLLDVEHLGMPVPLVGRDREIQLISNLLDTIASARPVGARALMIRGEMGIGKTRLLAAMCSAARERGLRVLEASSYESSSMLPYFPFVEALRPLLRSASVDQLSSYVGLSGVPSSQHKEGRDTTGEDMTSVPLAAALARLFPELPSMVGIETPLLNAAATEIRSPEQDKFRLFDAVATLLERASLEQATLLCIDNLHWADSASLELMLYLIMRLRTSQVALVGATRPLAMGRRHTEENDAARGQAVTVTATRVLSDFIRQGLLLFLPLGPLSSDAAQQHLHALLHGILPQNLAHTLLSRAQGNPFFQEELVRSLTQSQQLVLREGEWRATEGISSSLPNSIILAVQQRLQGLSEECRELLHIASLFGRTFPLDALAQVAEQCMTEQDASKKVRTLIGEAVQASVIAQTPALSLNEHEAPTFSMTPGPQSLHLFCQSIVQEVLQGDVAPEQARSLHCAIGRVLEASYAHEAHNHAAELAHHYALGGQREATVRWSLLAGEDALRHQAYREAIHHFRLALKLGEVAENTGSYAAEQVLTHAQLHLTIGDIWFRLGELEQAAHAFQHALQGLQRTPEPPPFLLAQTHRQLADLCRMQAKYSQAVAHLQAARCAFEQIPLASEATDDAPTRTMQEPWFLGRSLARTTPVSVERVTATEHILLLQAEAMLDLLLHHAKEAEESLWQSHQVAISIGDRGSQAFALHMVGWIRGWGEQIHEAIRLQEQAHELYVAIGDPFRAALGEQGLGIIYQALGEMERARRYTQRGMERARRYGVRRILGWLYWNAGVMSLTQGEWTGSESNLQQALQEAVANNDARLKTLVLQGQAELQFRRGNWPDAEHLFFEAIQAAIGTEWLPSSTALYGHFLAVTGRRAAAHVQLDRAAVYPEPPGFPGHFYIPFLAEGYLHIDARERAAIYIERIEHQRGLMYYGISVDRILGEVATCAGDWEKAERAFEEGLILCQRANNQPEEAAILYEQARSALLRDATEHKYTRRIHTLCTRAHTLFLHYEMQRAADLVEKLREGAVQLEEHEKRQTTRSIHAPQAQQGRPASAGVLHLQLTKREREVLQLVAEGHTDREVADILVISPRTANRHLSNIFVKLDVPSRAAAVAYAIRQGLV